MAEGIAILLVGGVIGFWLGHTIAQKPATDVSIPKVGKAMVASIINGNGQKAEFIMPDRVQEILSKKPDASLDDVIL